MDKIKNYLCLTKLGHFIALFTISVLLEFIMLVIYPPIFVPMVAGSFFTSLFISITDKSKRWA